MRTKRIIQLTAIASVMLAPFAVQAALLVNFEILNPSQVVAASEVVSLQGRVTNDLSSDEKFTGPFGASFNFGSTIPAYSFAFGELGFSMPEIDPGDFFDFVFGTLTPSLAPVPDGTYTSGPLTIFYNDAAGQSLSSRWDSISVAVGRQAVPEPATLALLGIGLAGLGAMQRFRRL